MSRADTSRGRAVAIAADPRLRRRAYALAILVLALLTVFPQPDVARAKLLPQDNNSIGLGSMMNALGGQLQGIAGKHCRVLTESAQVAALEPVIRRPQHTGADDQDQAGEQGVTVRLSHSDLSSQVA